ncbi:hypothetical protein phiCPV4_0011 [Clostridium phage phiCPV4]|uniref:Tail fiber protein n=1 Tax=Clostridium phage phiCPV4 TaxID=1162305 RepID=I3PV41_9CAUD|nr:hypothetical protein PHICPV4_gp11 [Clostridium phage phiCPV4]AFH27117.1 hypothetical protein phiCPV4_0011 [Clostridium phage phiCPV4]WQZ40886.1 hypothetical protein [Clostridium phage XP15-N3]
MIDLGKVKGEDAVVNSNHNGLLGMVTLNDKTCLQWGYFTITKGNTWERVNINVPYKDDNYNIQVTEYYVDGYKPVYIGNIDKAGFSVSTDGDIDAPGGKQNIYWFCIGVVE